MDNVSCIEFLLLIYHWILDDIEEQNQPQPVYIEMQPLGQRIYPAPNPKPYQPPLIRQRKHVCSESPEFLPISEPVAAVAAVAAVAHAPATPVEDVFETDFEIIEIADLNKEE